ncbi:probable sucrose-phosphate synthase 2 [Tanacetum coccineum]
MESIMRNKELTEIRMMQEELESVERRAEEERNAHNATKMAAMEKEVELEHTALDSSIALAKIHAFYDANLSDISEVKVEYLDNLHHKECFTEQGDTLTFETEVDQVYIGSPHMVRVFDHEKRRTFLIRKEGLPDGIHRSHPIYTAGVYALIEHHTVFNAFPAAQEIDEQWGLYDGFDVKLEKGLRTHIQEFVDGPLAHVLNMSTVLGEQLGGGHPDWPYVIHGHYANAGDSAAILSGALNVPMV